MSISTKITKPLEQGYVQVDSTTKHGYKRYYKVPQKNANIFVRDLKEQDKTVNMYTNLAFWLSIIVGIAGATYLTRNFESRIRQFIAQTATAIGLSSLAVFCTTKYSQNKQQELLQRYNAREIYYRA